MKRCNLYLSVFFCLCCVGTAAQDAASPLSDELAKKKEINKIKLSEQAVYADITEMISDDEEALSLAHQKSRDMLQAHVIEIFAKRMKMSKKDVQEIWEVIDDKCQNIVVKKGDLFRVFSYVMKDAIGLGPKKPKEGDVEKYMETQEPNVEALSDPVIAMNPIEDSVTVADSVAESSLTLVSDSVAEPVTVTVPEAVAEAVPELMPDSAISSEQTDEEKTDVKPEVMSEPEQVTGLGQTIELGQATEPELSTESEQVPESEQIIEPEPMTVPTSGEPTVVSVSIAVPDRVQAMLGKNSMNELVRYLNIEKQNSTLIYGNMRTMQNPEKCYVVIIEKNSKNIVAILGQGNGNRINYVTGQQDCLDNYKGGNHSAIFVQEY